MVNLEARETVELQSTLEPKHAAAAHRRAPVRLIVVVLAVVVIGVGALVAALVLSGGQARRAHVAVRAVGNHTEIDLTNGNTSIGELASTLAASKHAALLTSVSGGGWELRAVLVVGSRAQLTVKGTPLLMLSDNTTVARIIVAGGRAQFVATTVSSWTNAGQIDADLTDGRADIVAQGVGSSLQFDHAQIVGLGADTDDPGVSLRQGATGSIVHSSFVHCFRGLYAYKSGDLSVVHSSFRDNAENGALVLSPAARTDIESSAFSGNGANGLEVDNASHAVLRSVTSSTNRYSGISAHSDTDLAVSSSFVYENRISGVALTSSVRTTLTGVRIFANALGAQINGGTTVLEDSYVSANSANGVFTTGPSTVVTAHGNRFDHNGGGGLWIADGKVAASHNDFDSNRTGVEVNDTTPDVTLIDNSVTNSSLDGIGLITLPPASSITGNTISHSAKAAFSTSAKRNVAALLKANVVRSGQPKYRVRGN